MSEKYNDYVLVRTDGKEISTFAVIDWVPNGEHGAVALVDLAQDVLSRAYIVAIPIDFPDRDHRHTLDDVFDLDEMTLWNLYGFMQAGRVPKLRDEILKWGKERQKEVNRQIKERRRERDE